MIVLFNCKVSSSFCDFHDLQGALATCGRLYRHHYEPEFLICMPSIQDDTFYSWRGPPYGTLIPSILSLHKEYHAKSWHPRTCQAICGIYVTTRRVFENLLSCWGPCVFKFLRPETCIFSWMFGSVFKGCWSLELHIWKWSIDSQQGKLYVEGCFKSSNYSLEVVCISQPL